MNIYLWTAEILLGILWLYSLYAVLNPEKTIQFTIDRNMKAMRFYKFKASIKPTKRSAEIIKKGHMLVLALLTIYMIMVYFYGNAFIGQLIK